MTLTQNDTVVLSSAGLHSQDVYRIAVEHARLELATEVEERLAAGRAVIERAAEAPRLVYGLNPRLGHQRDTPVPPEEMERYQLDVLQSHVGGVGPPLPDEDVRAIMLVRITSAASGASGLHPGYI